MASIELRAAAQAVLDRWDSPAWEWIKQGPTAALMSDLRAALAEPVQEPVAHLWQHSETGRTRVVMLDQVITADATWFVVGPLYLAPPQRKPLTEEEIMQCFDEAVADYVDVSDAEMVDFARAIERAHGIGGEG